ncbi:jg8739, partial [Pararge aegeria aegeria]
MHCPCSCRIATADQNTVITSSLSAGVVQGDLAFFVLLLVTSLPSVEENAKEYITDAVRNVSQAPLLCESILRNAYALEVQTHAHARLMDELAKQRAAGQKIHVDNALK